MSSTNERGLASANSPDPTSQLSAPAIIADNSGLVEAQNYLTSIDEERDQFYFRLINRNNGAGTKEVIGDIGDVFPELKQHNDSGWDVFVVVNSSAGFKNEDVTGINSVFLDFDNPDGLEAASPKLDWPLDPMMIVQTSPAKYHYYFGIGNGIEVVSIEDFNRITKAMLSAHPEMDKAVVRPCNLMRVPGFINNKGKDGFKAKIISREPHQIYEVGDFLEQYPTIVRAAADVQRLEGISEDIASTDEADRARSALESIDMTKLPVGQDGHDIRMRMGFALHQCFSIADDELHRYGRQVWLDWCTQDAWSLRDGNASDYSEERCIGEWDRMDAGKEFKTGMGSLYSYCRDSWNWTDPRTSLDFGELPEAVAEPVNDVSTEGYANAVDDRFNNLFSKCVSAYDVLDKEVEPVSWLIPNLVQANQVGLVHGPSGVGKSWLLLQMFLDATEPNKMVMGNPKWQVDEAVRTLYISFEDLESQFHRRVKDYMGFGDRPACWGNFTFVPMADELKVQKLVTNQIVDEVLKGTVIKLAKHLDANHIIIDTLRSAYTGSEDNDDYAAIVDPMREIRSATGAAVTFVAHNRKGNRDDPDIESVRGGATIVDAVRYAFGLAENATEKNRGLRVEVEKMTEGKEGEVFFFKREDDHSGVLTFDAQGVKSSVSSARDIQEVKGEILKVLKEEGLKYKSDFPDSPLTKSSIIDAVGSKRRTLKLIEEGLKAGWITKPSEASVRDARAAWKGTGQWSNTWTADTILEPHSSNPPPIMDS